MSHWTSSPAVPLLLLQLIGRLRGDLVVDQEPRLLPALKGQSAGLRCSYQVSGEEDVFRSVFYWTVRDPGGDLTVIHPAPPARYRGRLELLRESGGRTVTLRIDQLRLNDTESYSCYISFLVNEHSISREGPGSQLFVYEPLVLTPPPRDCPCRIRCEARVGNRSAVRIVWFRDGVPVEGETEGPTLASGDGEAYSVVSSLALPILWTERLINHTCALTHSEMGIIDRQEHLTRLAPLRHPMLLYGLLLASSVLILVLVIVIGLTTSSRCSHNRTLHVAARS